jgi:hypothetical protein
MACKASGGVWNPWMTSDSTGTHPPHCEMDGGVDGAGSGDDASDGSAAD